MSDYFSVQSSLYVRNRPGYPDELFSYLSSLCTGHNMAWDCATGNGQSAVSLSKYFNTVYATDFSAAQINNSFKKENIIYKVEKAEQSSHDDESADLITVSTAIHWFDIPAFYKEAHRVLKKGGVLAVWSYGGCSIEPVIDEIVNHFAFEMLEDYWPPQATMNWKDKYRSLPFPYPIPELPSFNATAMQNLDDFLNYINSWSAVQIYKAKKNINPVDLIAENISQLWGNREDVKLITWPLFLKCGIKQNTFIL